MMMEGIFGKAEKLKFGKLEAEIWKAEKLRLGRWRGGWGLGMADGGGRMAEDGGWRMEEF
jgi:hypothetical protein